MLHRSRLALALSSLALVLVVLASPAAARLRAGIPRAQPIHVHGLDP